MKFAYEILYKVGLTISLSGFLVCALEPVHYTACIKKLIDI